MKEDEDFFGSIEFKEAMEAGDDPGDLIAGDPGEGDQSKIQTKFFTMRLSVEEHEQFKRQARQSGFQLGEYVRRLIKSDLERKPLYPVLPQERFEIYMEMAKVREWLDETRKTVSGDQYAPALWAAIDRLGENFRQLQGVVLSGLPEKSSGESSEEFSSGGGVFLTEEEMGELSEKEFSGEGGVL